MALSEDDIRRIARQIRRLENTPDNPGVPNRRPPRDTGSGSNGTRVGVTGAGGISARIGSYLSGGITGGVAGISPLSGQTFAAGTGTVTLWRKLANGQMQPLTAVTVYNALSSAVAGNTWVVVSWDATSSAYWVHAADCPTS